MLVLKNSILVFAFQINYEVILVIEDVNTDLEVEVRLRF